MVDSIATFSSVVSRRFSDFVIFDGQKRPFFRRSPSVLRFTANESVIILSIDLFRCFFVLNDLHFNRSVNHNPVWFCFDWFSFATLTKGCLDLDLFSIFSLILFLLLVQPLPDREIVVSHGLSRWSTLGLVLCRPSFPWADKRRIIMSQWHFHPCRDLTASYTHTHASTIDCQCLSGLSQSSPPWLSMRSVQVELVRLSPMCFCLQFVCVDWSSGYFFFS